MMFEISYNKFRLIKEKSHPKLYDQMYMKAKPFKKMSWDEFARQFTICQVYCHEYDYPINYSDELIDVQRK